MGGEGGLGSGLHPAGSTSSAPCAGGSDRRCARARPSGPRRTAPRWATRLAGPAPGQQGLERRGQRAPLRPRRGAHARAPGTAAPPAPGASCEACAAAPWVSPHRLSTSRRGRLQSSLPCPHFIVASGRHAAVQLAHLWRTCCHARLWRRSGAPAGAADLEHVIHGGLPHRPVHAYLRLRAARRSRGSGACGQAGAAMQECSRKQAAALFRP